MVNMLAVRRTVAAFAMAASAWAASAATLHLTVNDRDGKPVPDVVVLVDFAPGRPPARPAAAPVVIAQENLRFVPFLTVVPVGSTLRFVNRDGYDHHVRSTPSGPLGSVAPASTFELRLDPGRPRAGAYEANPATDAPARPRSGVTSADVKVDKPGPIGLGCHIHGSMRGQVYVADTPYFGKTDERGGAVVEGLPEGLVTVTLWHADELQPQTPLRLQLEGAEIRAAAALNFAPRRRR